MSNQFPFDQFLKIEKETESEVIPDYLNQPVQIKESKSDESEFKIITQEILNLLQQEISPLQYKTYFANTLSVGELNETGLTLYVTTPFIKKIIEAQYLGNLSACISRLFGKNLHLQIVALNGSLKNSEDPDEQIEARPRNLSAKDMSFKLQDEPTDVKKPITTNENNRLTGFVDPKKTFDTFIIGSSNNLAHAAALAVSNSPGEVYSSLYIYGKSGLGKTHLIHAIANQIMATRKSYRIEVVSCINFVNEFVEYIMQKKIFEFKKKYENIDVLIIDDIHELSNKESTQEHFFHILNDLTNKKKQLVFTSDKTPKEITHLEDRLKSRLSSALIVELHQPDYETRIAILKAKAQERDMYLCDEVVSLIAKCVKSNIRELEGCLVKLAAYSSFMKVDIDLQIAREQLKLDEEIENQKNMTMESISKTVAHFYKISWNDIRGKSKTKDIVQARQVAIYLIHNNMKKTLLEIAQFFNKKDHTTIMHSLDVVKEKFKSDTALSQQLVEIEKVLS